MIGEKNGSRTSPTIDNSHLGTNPNLDWNYTLPIDLAAKRVMLGSTVIRNVQLQSEFGLIEKEIQKDFPRA